LPTTCEAAENFPDESISKPKPVMAVAAMGETPMSPVIVELGTVEIPLFARMVKLQADPRSIGEGPLGPLLGDELVTLARTTVGKLVGLDIGTLDGPPAGALVVLSRIFALI
jgi:hypothetical protein